MRGLDEAQVGMIWNTSDTGTQDGDIAEVLVQIREQQRPRYEYR